MIFQDLTPMIFRLMKSNPAGTVHGRTEELRGEIFQ